MTSKKTVGLGNTRILTNYVQNTPHTLMFTTPTIRGGQRQLISYEEHKGCFLK